MSDTQTSAENTRLIGMVKWFNNKTGYGFITACEGEQKGKDIFVHYTSIQVENPQYRFLSQGEYVDFALVKSDTEKYEYLAKNITGVKGGPILCESRRVNFTERRSPPSNRPEKSSDRVESNDDGFVQVKKQPRSIPRKTSAQ